MKLFVKFILFLLLGVSSGAVIYGDEPIFTPQEHCLAYQTEKEMFFISGVEVVGKSCDLTTDIQLSENEKQIKIVISVPVKSFDSDSGTRDEHVFEILSGETEPNVTFTADPIDVAALKEGVAKGQMDVAGLLKIAKGEHQVTFKVQFKKEDNTVIASGRLDTTYSKLNITVPTVGPGGLIADVADKISFLLHLRADKLSGEKVLALFK